MTIEEFLNINSVTGMFKMNEIGKRVFLNKTESVISSNYLDLEENTIIFYYAKYVSELGIESNYEDLEGLNIASYYTKYVSGLRGYVDDIHELASLGTIVTDDSLCSMYKKYARNIINSIVMFSGDKYDYYSSFKYRKELYSILDVVIKSIGVYDKHSGELEVFGQKYTGVKDICFRDLYRISWSTDMSERTLSNINNVEGSGNWKVAYREKTGRCTLRRCIKREN